MSLTDQIEQAFDGVPFPGPGSRSLRQANAWDDYASCDQSLDHKGRWQDIPDSEFMACQWALPHLDAPGLHYYLPAAMLFTLRTRHTDSCWLHDSLEFTLHPSEGDLRGYQQERLGPLTPEQRAAVAAFVEEVVDDPDVVRRWQAVVEHDRAGGDDWFSVFNPG